MAELMQWRSGLDKQWAEARGYYSILLGATLLGTARDFTPLDPVKALFWSISILVWDFCATNSTGSGTRVAPIA